MKTLLLSLLVVLSCGFARASDSRDNAEKAQAMLGPRVWSRLVRVDNSNHRSAYPRSVYATIFELAGVLWFYTDENGTQSLSLHRDNLAEEKADLKPLLLAIDPGFGAFEVLNTGASRAMPPSGDLLNGCFIESVATLRVRSEAGLPAIHPQLLAFYLPERLGGRGHTVLTFEASGKLNVLDCEASGDPKTLPLDATADPARIAGVLTHRPIARARLLAVRDFTFTGNRWAGS